MDIDLLRLVAVICATAGIGMLLAPRAAARLEETLNREWGSRPIVALRTGLPGERRIEEVLNAPILSRSVVWDDLLRRNLRTTGLGLCCVSVALWWVG